MNNSVAKELEYIIGSTVGGTEMLKYIANGDGFILSACAAQIIDNIDSESTHYHVINSSLQSHHKTYGSCCKTLVLMTSFFYHEIMSLVRQGFQAADVVRLSHECLGQTLPNLDCIKIPLHQLTASKPDSKHAATGKGNAKQPTSGSGDARQPISSNGNAILLTNNQSRTTAVNWSRFLQSSRHLQDTDDDETVAAVELNAASMSLQATGDDGALHSSLLRLCHGLLHGAYAPLADLLATASERLLTARHVTSLSHARLDTDSIQVHAMVGPLSAADGVYEGLIVRTTPQQLALVRSRCNSPCRALLLVGDVTSTYRHIGHKSLSNASVVIDYDDAVHQRANDWVQDCCRDLQELKIKVVLVHGEVDDRLVDACEALGIVVIGDVPRGVLHALSSASRCLLASYVSECSEDNVACDVTVDVLSTNWLDSITTPSACFVVIKAPACHTQTVLLCHPCEGVLAVRQEAVSHMTRRLHHTLHAGHCLPGAGASEAHLASCCDKLAEDLLRAYSKSASDIDVIQLLKTSVFQVLSKAFSKFARTVKQNIELSRTESSEHDADVNSSSSSEDKSANKHNACIYDDSVAKTAAWWTALHTASQLALIGYQVVTGSVNQPISLQSSEGTFLCSL